MSRFQFVEDNHGAYGVKRLCRILGVSRSGYYRWQAGKPTRLERARADRELGEQIRAIHAESDGTYGRPRIAAELRRGAASQPQAGGQGDARTRDNRGAPA